MMSIEEVFFAEKYCFWRNVAAIAGVLWLALVLVKEARNSISGFRAYFLSPIFGFGRLNLKKYGSWAVITGSSEGIGRGYAHELARQGLNVVLMSRSREKLQRVADEIKDQFRREVLIIPIDFSSDLDIYDGISQQLQELDIAILVNNVGMFYEIPDVVGNVPPKKLYSVTKVNTHPVIQMSRLVLPNMLKKKKGIIINISSIASSFPIPQMVVYSATKVFTNYVSDGLRKEHGYNGIIVQNVIPYFVATSMTHIKRSSFSIPDALSYARSAVATIGIQDTTLGCFSHSIQGCIGRWTPLFVKDWLLWRFTNRHRERFLHVLARSKTK